MNTERCGYTLVDADGEQYPCDRPAPSWRWYQDVEHEDSLDEACELHENEGGRRMAAQAEQIAAVLALHYPSNEHNEPGWGPYCVGCWESGGMDGAPTYPCPTARALGVSA